VRHAVALHRISRCIASMRLTAISDPIDSVGCDAALAALPSRRADAQRNCAPGQAIYLSSDEAEHRVGLLRFPFSRWKIGSR
jgi:hypothetical protein